MAAWGNSALPDGSSKAEFTGERVIPGQVDADLLNEHLSRYAFARRFAPGLRVLDLGCGAGYGSALLAEVAAHVTGLDASADAVAHARESYSLSNLNFEHGDAAAPQSTRFELITAFEVIEHLDQWREMLESSRDALTETGLFLVSTPNKPLYAEARGPSGGNPFHVHEFEYHEFREALEQQFPHVQMFVQNHSAGILISPVSGSPHVSGSLGDTAVDVDHANFFVALCSLQAPPPGENYFWISSSANLLRERDRHIALLRNENQLKTQWEENTRVELFQRNREYEELLVLHRFLQNDLESRNQWAAQQDELLRQRGERIVALQSELESAHGEFSGITSAYQEQLTALENAYRHAVEWARETERRLTDELEQRGAVLAQYVDLLQNAEQIIEERTAWAQSLDGEIAQWRLRFEALRRKPWVRVGTRLKLMADLR